jgi:hypothetical protein
LAGHESTIVGTKQGRGGVTIFICQDSDDEFDTPIEMPESFLLPAIHHAGLPDEIASRSEGYSEKSWKIGVRDFEENRKRA